jgi:hypothetical protein
LGSVRYTPGSNQIPHRNEMTGCAKSEVAHTSHAKKKPPEGGFDSNSVRADQAAAARAAFHFNYPNSQIIRIAHLSLLSL